MTIRRASPVVLCLVVALGLSACAGDDPADDDVDASATDVATTTDEVAEADEVAETAEAEEPSSAPAEPSEGGPVAVCDLLGGADVAALLEDELREPRPGDAAGNMLGTCSWSADNNGRTLSMWAWPVELWDEAIATDGFGVGPIDGLGVRAERTSDDGLLVDPGTGHYYLQLFVIDTDGSINLDLAQAAAALATGS